MARARANPEQPAATVDPAALERLLRAEHDDPFALLGMHAGSAPGRVTVRCFIPGAEAVEVLERGSGALRGRLTQQDGTGFFAGEIAADARFAYRLRVGHGGAWSERDDAYAFAPLLGELDSHLLAEGRHWQAYRCLGAHFLGIDGVDGAAFAVWAPNAQRVSVVGDFNQWDGRVHPMRRRRECGVWEIFVPGVEPGQCYKYEIRTADGALARKSDPFAFWCEVPPATASRVPGRARFAWSDADWMATRGARQQRDAPLSIYELHLGSWRRDAGGRALDYATLADQLVAYVLAQGYTHIELLPVSEHPFGGSWGYQPTALFAPTSRYGSPDEFRLLIDRCHAAGIGVLLDWVAAHFPGDAHALARFDGTCLYEHEDPRQGRHPDWDTLIYNYGRREVANFLIANALYWLHEFHVDGLRVDAVASMLYLDYSRAPDDWIPNVHGGRENLEALAFLRDFNLTLHREAPPGVITIAEESTAWPMVTRPPEHGGLGFNYKWNLGWMHDTLRYMRLDPVYRRHHQEDLTFGLLYAHSENFLLALSHDEVVHGKGSLLGKMPGDRWQRFANLRLYLAFLFTQPGKKLLFMGGELGEPHEWNHDGALDWALLDDPAHRGVQALVRDLNRLYRSHAALHQGDCEPHGFRWIDCEDRAHSVIAYLRLAQAEGEFALVVCNFTPVVRHGYRVGVPRGGRYRELLNSDAHDYGGSGVGNLGGVGSEAVPCHGQAQSLALTLPPLAALILLPEAGAGP